ncbi:hypothetical protein niasHT_019804 [Heterodera trifolii]|uniref:Sodium/nucleoside cotransporter n=1 Tax=Heterodera trifolii TaxID=157864 RepID=A0ABD2KUZ8_9BILA
MPLFSRQIIWFSLLKMLCHPKRYFRSLFMVVFLIGVHLFALCAAIHNIRTALPVLAVLFICHTVAAYKLFLRQRLEPFLVRPCFGAVPTLHPSIIHCIQITVPTAIIVLFVVWLIIDSSTNRIRLRSLFGFLSLITFCYFSSAHRLRIKWRPVISGILLQLALGFLILRWPPGSDGFRWVSEKMLTLLNFSYNGTNFVYGFAATPPPICGLRQVFMFTALQIIIYFGAIVALLYHFGIVQAVLSTLSRVLQTTIGTTAAESLNAIACIFLGQTESAILIEPSIITMTASEIHCMMTAGFACIAGALFSAYIALGNCPIHLLSATLMNAAISLGISKLVYPEVEHSQHKEAERMKFAERDNEETILECITASSIRTSHFAIAIGANLVTYIALLAFLNSTIGWLGSMVGIAELSFNKILGFCFFPLAWAMGVSDAQNTEVMLDETMKVAELMGIKTALNEFIAYQRLAQMVANGTLNGARAKMVAFRSFVSGVCTSFLTTCVAGMLVDVPMACNNSVPHGADEKCLNLDTL